MPAQGGQQFEIVSAGYVGVDEEYPVPARARMGDDRDLRSILQTGSDTSGQLRWDSDGVAVGCGDDGEVAVVQGNGEAETTVNVSGFDGVAAVFEHDGAPKGAVIRPEVGEVKGCRDSALGGAVDVVDLGKSGGGVAQLRG